MSTPVLFPYPPRDNTFSETVSYRTEVLTAENGSEQRIAQRSIPGGELAYELIGLSAPESAEMLALLRSNLTGKWIIPLWPEVCLLAAALYGGETFLPLRVPASGWTLLDVAWASYPGQFQPRVVLYRMGSGRAFATRIVRLAGVCGWGGSWGKSWGRLVQPDPPGLHITDGVPGAGRTGWSCSWGKRWGAAEGGPIAWPAGSLVIPGRLARLDSEVATQIESAELLSGPLIWTVDEDAA
jgi:hypothetical protein